MNRTWTLWATALWLGCTLLSGCGGGGSTNQNSDERGNDETTSPLTLSSSSIPDANLRACLSALAVTNGWTRNSDVDQVQCDAVEIRSIAGLQQFPNLSELNISAPRLAVSELPILAALPLADYQHQPFYRNDDRSNPDNVFVGIKQMLMQDSVVVVKGQPVTTVMLVAHDPSQADDELVWWLDNNGPDTLPLAKGKLPINAYLTLHWATQGADENANSSYRNFPVAIGATALDTNYYNRFRYPTYVAADRALNTLNLPDSLSQCVADAATQNGWTRSDQVTELDCLAYDFDSADYSALRDFPQLRRLSLNANTDVLTDYLSALPNLEALYIPGWVTDQRALAAYPWTVTPSPGNPLPEPVISVQSCGLQIDNYDNTAEYQLLTAVNDGNLLTNTRQLDFLYLTPSPWPGGATADCMTPQANTAHRVCVTKADQTVCAESIPVTDTDGNVMQMIYEDYLTEPSTVLPGIPGDYFYVARLGNGEYMLEQYQLATWQPVRAQWVSGTPVYATEAGVYLVDESSTWFVDNAGVVQTLPPRPVPGMPFRTLAYQGEVWFYNIEDPWGGRPEAVIWNPQQQQWRTQRLPEVGTTYLITVVDGQLCLDSYEADGAARCLMEDGTSWLATEPGQRWFNGATQYDFTISTAQWTNDFEPLLLAVPIAGINDIYELANPIHLATYGADWRALQSVLFELPISLDYKNRPAPLLDNRNPAAPQAIAPVLPNVPWYSHYTVVDDTLYVLYNDSVARYPLPE